MTEKNQIRIIGGKWRGRKLNFPNAFGLRPTHDRIRETLFNWLAPQIFDSNCLELFAGSGAIGFEALSRGAHSVTFIDQCTKVTNQLKKNKLNLNAECCEIIRAQIPSEIAKISRKPFDIIFIDPPYHQNLIEKVVPWVSRNHFASKGTLIYIECEINYDLSKVLPTNWIVIKNKHTQTISYYLIEVGSPS